MVKFSFHSAVNSGVKNDVSKAVPVHCEGVLYRDWELKGSVYIRYQQCSCSFTVLRDEMKVFYKCQKIFQKYQFHLNWLKLMPHLQNENFKNSLHIFVDFLMEAQCTE